MRHLLQCRHGIPIFGWNQTVFWEDSMLSLGVRPLLALCAVAAVLAFAMTDADARAGRGGSFGSRGSQTFSAPPSTTTSPTARPIERSMTQPGQPGGALAQRPATAPNAAPTGGLFGRPGFMGGLFAGFLGAGLLGMLFGHGLTGGLGGFASMLGLMLQIGIVVVISYLLWTWWQRRSQPALANGPAYRDMSAGDSRRRTSTRSSGCSAKSRPPTAPKTSAACGPAPRPRWCPTSPRNWRRTPAAASSTASPTSSSCRATSPRHGGRATPTTPRSRSALRSTTRRSTA